MPSFQADSKGATRVAFKPEVRLIRPNLTAEMIRVIQMALDTCPPLQGDTLVVTSAADGQHSLMSLHQAGEAFDIRCFGVREGAIASGVADDLEAQQRVLARLWVGRLRECLGRDYDVILESDHIHVERDLK